MPSPQSDTLQDNDPLVQLTDLIACIQEQFDAHPHPMNQKGAMFHKVSGYWFSVHPIVINLAIQSLNEQADRTLTLEVIMPLLIDLGFQEVKGAFMQNGQRKATVNLLHWPNELVERVLGEKRHSSDNAALTLW